MRKAPQQATTPHNHLPGLPAYLTPRDVTQVLGMSPKTLATWRREGHGPPYQRFRRFIRYPRQALEQWLAEHPLLPLRLPRLRQRGAGNGQPAGTDWPHGI